MELFVSGDGSLWWQVFIRICRFKICWGCHMNASHVPFLSGPLVSQAWLG